MIDTSSTTFTRRSVLKIGVVGTAALALGSSLSACGPTGSSALQFAQFYAPESDVKAQNAWFTELIKQWNANNDQQVELQYIPSAEYSNGSKLQSSFSAGDGPDVFVVSSGDFLRYYNGGVLVNLTPYMSKEAIEDFYPDLMGARKVDGDIYALPMGGGPMAMYYSVPALEGAGLSEADLPTTWEGFLDVCERLTTDKGFGTLFETVPGYYQNFTWYPFMWMAGGDVPTAESAAPFSVEGTAAAGAFWGDAVKRGVAPRKALGSSASDIVANLGSGYAAFQNIGMWGISAMAAGKPDLDYGIMKLPLPADSAEYATATGGWCFAANANGRDPEAAAKFVVWAIGSMESDSIERVATWCTEAQSYLPYRKSSMLKAEELGAFENPKMKAFRDEIFVGARSEPRMPPEFNKVISDFVQSVQLNGVDSIQALDTATAALDKALASYKGAPPA